MSKFIYGVDVGGTNIKIGLFLLPEMKLIFKKQIKTPIEDQKTNIFSYTASTIRNINKEKKIDYADVEGVGLAIPCPVKNGIVKNCPNLDLDNLDIINSMKKELPKGIKIAVSNDATLAALGENESLKKPFSNAVFYTLGTGVGGGIIIDGRILEGGTGLGGEIGHIKVFEGQSDACGCGAQGCLEQICGTAGIKSYAKKLATIEPTIIDFEKVTVKTIFDAAKLGDVVGLKVVDRVAEYIARSASMLAVIVNPDVFIIGGGISEAGKFFVDMIVDKYQKHARFSTHEVPFSLAMSGNDAGFIGAAHLVKNKL